MDLQMLKQQRARLLEQCHALLDEAEREGRGLTDEERGAYDARYNDAEELRRTIEHNTVVNPHRAGREDTRGGAADMAADYGGRGRVVGLTPDGREVRALRPEEQLSDQLTPEERRNATVELGRIVRAHVTGDPSGLTPEQRAGAGSSTVGGGILLSRPVSARVIDMARSKARVIQAGALTVPMGGRELTVAVVESEPTPEWRAENEALPVGDVTFGGLVFQARTLGTIVQSAVELVEDAGNLGQLVEDVISETLALELDRVALVGTGSAEEPLGVENASGVNTITSVGTPSDFDDFSNAVQDVAEANGEATAVILAPRDMGTLDRLKDTTNQPLRPPESWAGLTKLPTNQCPTTRGAGSNESLAIVGDFSNLWIGVRTEVTIEASRSAADSTTSAFRNLQVWVRGYMRADVGVVRPTHFCVLSGITA